jgi:hypothetical protein
VALGVVPGRGFLSSPFLVALVPLSLCNRSLRKNIARNRHGNEKGLYGSDAAREGRSGKAWPGCWSGAGVEMRQSHRDGFLEPTARLHSTWGAEVRVDASVGRHHPFLRIIETDGDAWRRPLKSNPPLEGDSLRERFPQPFTHTSPVGLGGQDLERGRSGDCAEVRWSAYGEPLVAKSPDLGRIPWQTFLWIFAVFCCRTESRAGLDLAGRGSLGGIP